MDDSQLEELLYNQDAEEEEQIADDEHEEQQADEQPPAETVPADTEQEQQEEIKADTEQQSRWSRVLHHVSMQPCRALTYLHTGIRADSVVPLLNR